VSLVALDENPHWGGVLQVTEEDVLCSVLSQTAAAEAGPELQGTCRRRYAVSLPHRETVVPPVGGAESPYPSAPNNGLQATASSCKASSIERLGSCQWCGDLLTFVQFTAIGAMACRRGNTSLPNSLMLFSVSAWVINPERPIITR
jgi:hypothetical protein